MLQTVPTRPKSLTDYHGIVDDDLLEEIESLARTLRGARVVHVNATAFGGGVAEILQSLVPLMQDVGLETTWQVIYGEDPFFQVTKACHNGLQGMDLPFTPEMKRIWEHYNRENATRFEGNYDFVVVHDPQPAGLLRFTEGKPGRVWIWRCHIDTSHPNAAFQAFFLPYVQEYDAAIFTLRDFVFPGLMGPRIAIVPPTIDPLVPKNQPMDIDQARRMVEGFGVDPARPLILQVARFDPWKDPLGVIDAYRQVKAKVPSAQLALVGVMAHDDPEGWFYLDRVLRYAGEDFDIHVLHNFHGVGPVEVAAFQTVASVVVQKSLREGFGLAVAEALWKGKPVIGGRVGGIPLQVLDGKTGFLVDSVEEAAERMLYLLQHPEEAQRMGRLGREHVRRHFLIPRLLRDYLRLFVSLSQGGREEASEAPVDMDAD